MHKNLSDLAKHYIKKNKNPQSNETKPKKRTWSGIDHDLISRETKLKSPIDRLAQRLIACQESVKNMPFDKETRKHVLEQSAEYEMFIKRMYTLSIDIFSEDTRLATHEIKKFCDLVEITRSKLNHMKNKIKFC